MLISISGYMGSGKDFVTNIIQFLDYFNNTKGNMPTFLEIYKKEKYFPLRHTVEFSKWKNVKFADPLKEICSILTGIPRPDFEKPEVKNSYLCEDWDYIKDGVIHQMTVRELMQIAGTEALRTHLHPNTWVNAVFANYTEQSNWIISDTRFINELEAIKNRGGITIRVNRDENISMNDHISEHALDDADFDYIINNKTGEIDQLVEDVNDILIKENLL